MEGAVQRPPVAQGRDHRHSASTHGGGPDEETLVTHPRERWSPSKTGNQRGIRRRPDQQGAVRRDALHHGRAGAEESEQPSCEFGGNDPQGRRVLLDDDRRHRTTVAGAERRILDRHVAEPQIVAGLGARRPSQDGQRNRRHEHHPAESRVRRHPIVHRQGRSYSGTVIGSNLGARRWFSANATRYMNAQIPNRMA